MDTTLTVPLPPSANNLFFNRRTGGRAKSTAYRQWLATCQGEVLAQRVQAFPARRSMQINIAVELDRKRDLDNTIKPLIDMLQAAGVIENDKWVDSIHATRYRVPETGEPRARIDMRTL